LQDRLVNELRVAGITTLEAANVYLTETFLPRFNARFARAPRDPASAFVPLGTTDLDAILCHAEERIVARDNTVTLQRLCLQIAPQPGRRSCVGLRVTVRRHLDDHYTVSRGTQVLGRYDPTGHPLAPPTPPDRTASRRAAPQPKSGQITCQT
jgi:hypothetical protein